MSLSLDLHSERESDDERESDEPTSYPDPSYKEAWKKAVFCSPASVIQRKVFQKKARVDAEGAHLSGSS